MLQSSTIPGLDTLTAIRSTFPVFVTLHRQKEFNVYHIIYTEHLVSLVDTAYGCQIHVSGECHLAGKRDFTCIYETPHFFEGGVAFFEESRVD